MNSIYAHTTDALTGAFTMTSKEHLNLVKAQQHQISFTKNGGTTGTLSVQVKPAGTDRFENLTINGVSVSISMAANGTFGPFDGLFSEIKVTPAGFDGTNFTLTFAGG